MFCTNRCTLCLQQTDFLLQHTCFCFLILSSCFSDAFSCQQNLSLAVAFADDGYFGLNIDGDASTVRILSYILESIALVLQGVIGMVAVRRMLREKDISFNLSAAFMFSLFWSVTASICRIVWRSLDSDSSDTALLICYALWIMAMGNFIIRRWHQRCRVQL